MSKRTVFLLATIVVLALIILWALVYYYEVKPELLGVIIAMLAAIFSFLGVVVTWMTVQEMKLAREAQERPYIIVDFDLSEAPIINLVVSNIGNGAAEDVTFSFEPDLITSDGRNISASVLLFRQGVSFFPPGKTISQFFDMSHAYLGANKPLTFDVTVSYCEVKEGKEYTDSMQLDLSMFKGRLYIVRKGVHNLVEEVEKIRKSADNAVKKIEEITTKLDRGVRLNTYEFHVVTQATKQALLSKLIEFQNVWTYMYAESSEPYLKLDEVKGKCLSLGYEIANLASACHDLDDESAAQILQIASKINGLGRFRFYMDGGKSIEQFNSQGQEMLTLIQEIKPKLIDRTDV